MKQPYAVVSFKYRSKKVIERMFKIKIQEQGQSLKAKLADMSKDELVEELFRLKVSNLVSLISRNELTKALDGKHIKLDHQIYSRFLQAQDR